MEQVSIQQKYNGILAAVLYAASFLFPWFDLRANRVSAAEAFSVFSDGTPLTFVLFIPVLILVLALFLGNKKVLAAAVFIIPSVTAVLAIVSLPFLWELRGTELGEFGRMGLGFGFYLYLIAPITMLIPSSRPKYAAAALIVSLLAVLTVLALSGGLDQLGIVKEAYNQRRRLGSELVNHIGITLLSVSIASIIGIPAAVLSYQSTKIRKAVFPVMNILQTVPSIALFGLMIAPLAALSRAVPVLRLMGIRGIGNAPAVIALSLYALYPIIRYSYTGIKAIDPRVIDAGRGMGMNNSQLWKTVRLPLSTPVILHGIRVAFIQTLGNATLAKLIGGNGLGVFVFEGLGQASADMVLLGMFMIILLTVIADQFLGFTIISLTPRALRGRFGGAHE